MNRPMIASCALAASSALAPAVFAQTEPESEATVLETIIVTSSKRDTDLLELPGSYAIVSGSALDDLVEAEEIAMRLPGVQASIANGSQITFQIRGIGAVDHQALTPSAAAVYVDGLYQATNVQTSALLFDLDRVEVAKGPQGTLYGRNASSGAIQFISVEPGLEREGYVEGEIATFDRAGLNAAVTLPMNDKVSVRLAGRYLSQGPVLDNVGGPSEAGGRDDEFGLRATGLLRQDSGGEFLVSLTYSEDNGVNPAPLNDSLDLGDHEISIGADGVQDTDNEFYTASLRYRRDFGALSLVSLSGFTGYNQNYGFDFDGTTAPFGVASLNANLRYDRDFSQFSHETRLRWQGEALDLLGGLYLEAERFDQEYLIWCGVLDQQSLLGTCRYVGAPGRAGPSPVSSGTATTLQSLIEQDRDTAAVFGSAIIDLSPKFSLDVGLRLTQEEVKGAGQGRHIFDDGVVGLNNRDGLGLAEGQNSISDTFVSGRASLSYRASESVLTYATYSNGYKSGGFNGEVINNATHFADDGLFGSETVDALEVGVKAETGRVRASVAAFYQWYDRPQARISVPFSLADGGVFTSNSLSNLDRAVSYGLDASLVWQATEDFTLNTGLVLNETEISQDVVPSVPQNAETFDGNPLPFASDISFTLGADYVFALSPNVDFAWSGHAKYQSEFFLDAEGRDDRRQSGYTLVDTRGEFVFDTGLTLGLWARNLLNEDYATSGFGFIGYNTFRGAPRSYGASIRYAF